MLDEEKILSPPARPAPRCPAGFSRPSAINRDFADAQGTLVVTFGQENTEAEIDRFLAVLKDVVQTLRAMSPLHKKKYKVQGVRYQVKGKRQEA